LHTLAHECPTHQGHKGYTELKPMTCGILGEGT
jgi:hypothetical protein